MPTLTYDRIRIHGGFGLAILRDFELHVRPNNHAEVEFNGIVDEDTGFTEIEKKITGHEVSIDVLEDTGQTSSLFRGLARQVLVNREGEIYYIKGRISSGTYLLDMEKKSRSFQDISMTYKDVVNKVLEDTPHAAAIFTVGKDVKIGKPLIQYLETDWEFIKRLASHFGSYVIPEVTDSKPRFWFGMRNGSGQAVFSETDYDSVTSDAYYTLGGAEAGLKRMNYFYYVVRDGQNHVVGDKTTFKQKNLVICEKHACTEQGHLVFSYYVGRDTIAGTKKAYNEKITGMSLLGTVLETQGQTLKIHLDIDKQQSKGTAYPYLWAPATGNLMYCMPQVGTRVSLYFGSHDEHSAKAVNCIRTNGSASSLMADPNKRYFATEHGKQLQLLPDSLGLSGGGSEQAPLQMSLSDKLEVFFQSHKSFLIHAREQIAFESEKLIRVSAPLQVTFAQAGGGQAALNMNNQYDIIGVATNLSGSVHTGYPNYDDEPIIEVVEEAAEEKKFSWGKLIGNVLGGLAMVAVVAGAIALTVGTGGLAGVAIIGAIAVGSSMVIGQAVSDVISGEVSDTSEYLFKGFVGAVAGATSAVTSAVLVPELIAGSAMLGAGVAGAVETIVENAVFGQDTTAGELLLNFGIAAVSFGVLDNVVRGVKKLFGKGAKEAAEAAAKQADNVLEAGAKQADEVVEAAGKQADNIVDDVADSARRGSDSAIDTARSAQKDIIKAIENGDIELVTTKQKGNYGEMKMDDFFESQGYQRISSDRVIDLNTPTHQGIDGVYYNPNGHPPYVIGEAKYGTSKLSILSDGTPQMSDDWITGGNKVSRLEQSVGIDLADDILLEGYEKILTKIDTNGNIITYAIDASGNIIK